MTFNLNHDAAYDAGLICGGTLEIFVEPLLPPPMLYLFGGGHVSTAVARVAAPAGFLIGIIDDRETFANTERFPAATEIYTSYEDAFEKITAQLVELPGDRHARPQGRHARAGLGGKHQCPLHRNDRQQAQSDLRLQGAGKGRVCSREVRKCPCARRASRLAR